MSPRAFLIAFLGGALTAAAGGIALIASPCLVLYPTLPNWTPFPSLPDILPWSGAALTLLLFTGLAAGWFSRGRTTWGSIGAGALAGWTAAWIAEALLVGPVAGMWGAQTLQAHGLVPAANETAFVLLVAESVQSIILWVHASMALTALVGILFGALGGALGGLGARRAAPDVAFGLRLSGAMTLLSGLALVVMIVVYDLLVSTLQRTVEKANLTFPYPANWIFDAPVALFLLWWLLWVVLTWAFVRQAPAAAPVGFFSSLIFLGFPIPMFVAGLTQAPLATSPISLLQFLVAGLLFLAVGLGFTLLIPRRVWDFFRRQGEPRLMAWSLLGLNGLLFLAAFNAGPGEGWRRPWLTLGLLIGVLFALDSVRRTRPAEEPLEAPPALTASHLFRTAFSAHLLVNLTLALTTLAPLALVMLLIVAIKYLIPDASLTETGNWVEIASTYLSITPVLMGRLIFIGTPAASLTSLLIWTLWQKMSQYIDNRGRRLRANDPA